MKRDKKIYVRVNTELLEKVNYIIEANNHELLCYPSRVIYHNDINDRNVKYTIADLFEEALISFVQKYKEK